MVPGHMNPVLIIALILTASALDLIAAPRVALVRVRDIYSGLPGVERGEIAAIRVVQLFPKTTPYANSPRIGVAGEETIAAMHLLGVDDPALA